MNTKTTEEMLRRGMRLKKRILEVKVSLLIYGE